MTFQLACKVYSLLEDDIFVYKALKVVVMVMHCAKYIDTLKYCPWENSTYLSYVFSWSPYVLCRVHVLLVDISVSLPPWPALIIFPSGRELSVCVCIVWWPELTFWVWRAWKPRLGPREDSHAVLGLGTRLTPGHAKGALVLAHFARISGKTLFLSTRLLSWKDVMGSHSMDRVLLRTLWWQIPDMEGEDVLIIFDPLDQLCR